MPDLYTRLVDILLVSSTVLTLQVSKWREWEVYAAWFRTSKAERCCKERVYLIAG